MTEQQKEYTLWRDFLYEVGSQRFYLNGESWDDTRWEELMRILKDQGYGLIKGENLELKSHETLTHIDCLRTGVCQETKGLEGTRHEGVDMCEDGCVWYVPLQKACLVNPNGLS